MPHLIHRLALHPNLIYLLEDVFLDVDPEHATCDKYRATLCHKTNHSFTKANTVYVKCFSSSAQSSVIGVIPTFFISIRFVAVYHPRYGLTKGSMAIKSIRKNDEVLVNYNYELDPTMVPEWYKEVYLAEHGAAMPAAVKTST